MTWSDKELENERPKTSGDISKSPVELLQILRDGDSEALREALYALELNAKSLQFSMTISDDELLIQQAIQDLRPKLVDLPVRVYVAASGAGAGIQQLLWQTPGASAYLVGATFPYSPQDTEDFLGFRPRHFVCLETAIDLAISAYLKADNRDNRTPIGLGLTASVATTVEHRGDHRIYAVAISKDRVLASELTLLKQGSMARAYDGRTADAIGLGLLNAAAYVTSEAERLAYRETTKNCTDGSLLKDITQEARAHFLRRPLFTRYGKRLETPVGNHTFDADKNHLTLFPGNFDPPHEGHFASAGEDVLFQITANPPHKPGLSLTDMLGRVRHFRNKRDVLFLEGGALYLDKARRFPGSTIILGTDALERMLDPKWGVEVLPLLTEFWELGTRFRVGVREGADFRMLPIPEGFGGMFTELPKTHYAGLSSTQIRTAHRTG
jgi:hypothetical protein